MRTIDVKEIKAAVRDLCLKANFELRPDIMRALKKAVRDETNSRARGILKSIIENAHIAKKRRIAICQDTGMAVVFLDIGREVILSGGDIKNAVNEGVEDAYCRGYMRKSVVSDPMTRENTGTNSPAVLYIDIVEGDHVNITVSPKGFGSENKSRIRMFDPTASICEIEDFVIDVVRSAGPDACPPLVLGIGIGGTFEGAAILAKKALARSIEAGNPKRGIARIERGFLKKINSLGIGPMALGGKTTALGVNIIDAPTHIAALPVAVNVSCHATRGAEKRL